MVGENQETWKSQRKHFPLTLYKSLNSKGFSHKCTILHSWHMSKERRVHRKALGASILVQVMCQATLLSLLTDLPNSPKNTQEYSLPTTKCHTKFLGLVGLSWFLLLHHFSITAKMLQRYQTKDHILQITKETWQKIQIIYQLSLK